MSASEPTKSREHIERQVLELLLQVAPDVEPATLERDVAFREQFDFDSMDTLNFAIGIDKAFGVEVPEVDYGRLASLAQAVEYVEQALRAKHR